MINPENITAFIFAAGLGTRLKPLTDSKPKALVTVDDKALIDIVIDNLSAQGVGNFVVNIHHFANQIVDALKNRNIPINKNLIRHTDNNENIQIIGNGYKLMKELLESKEEFTAVYSISDSMAIGASKAILESGKRIPEDYSVVGFDGLDMTYYYNPSITTIRQPVEEMARETTKILFDLINKKAKNQHKVFEAELIIRESTSELSR